MKGEGVEFGKIKIILSSCGATHDWVQQWSVTVKSLSMPNINVAKPKEKNGKTGGDVPTLRGLALKPGAGSRLKSKKHCKIGSNCWLTTHQARKRLAADPLKSQQSVVSIYCAENYVSIPLAMGVTKGGGRLKLAWPPKLRSPLTVRAAAPTPLGLQRC